MKVRDLPELSTGPGDAMSQERVLPAQQRSQEVLLRWRGEPTWVTVLGSAAGGSEAVDVEASYEVLAVLRYRAGGVSRQERWLWNRVGFRRSVLADDVQLQVLRVPLDAPDASGSPVPVGGSLVFDADNRDELVQMVVDPAPESIGGGVFSNVALLPHGHTQMKVSQGNNPGGSFEVGFGWPTGTTSYGFTAYWSYVPSDMADWTPIPPMANAVRFNNPDVAPGDPNRMWVHSR